MPVTLPRNEQKRLQKLSEYGILDTAPEKAFDDIVRLAAQICGCPIAAVTLIDRDRQWFKAAVGVETRETSRDVSFCAHTILQSGLMHVTDTALDPRFRDNPLVTGEPRVRFYAGAPLVTAAGEALGALCVLDRFPRELSPEQREALEHLSRVTMAQLDLRKQTAEQQRALSEQARTAEALRESRRTLASLMDNVPGMVYRCRNDHDWGMEFVSQGCADLTGYDPQDLTEKGVPYASLIDPAYQGVVWAEVQAALRQRRPFRLVYPLTTRAGARRWVWEQGSGVFTSDGDLLHLEGFITDITDRYEAEEALRERERQLQTVTDNVPALISRVDAERRYVFANKAYEDWLGVPLEQVIGHTMAEVMGETAFEAVRPYTDRALAGETLSYVAELDYRTVGRRSVHVSYVPEFGAKGGVTGFFLSAIDITRQQREAQARAEAEERLAATVANLPVAIWAIDDKGVFTFSDGLALARIGLRPGQVVGQSLFERFAGRPDVLGYLREAFAGERAHWTAESDGVIFETRVTPLCDETGRITGLLGVSLDVTERHQAEAALDREREQYRSLAEGLGAGLLMTDLDDAIQYANPRMAEIMGYAPDEMIGKTALDLFLEPDDREAMRRRNQDRS